MGICVSINIRLTSTYILKLPQRVNRLDFGQGWPILICLFGFYFQWTQKRKSCFAFVKMIGTLYFIGGGRSKVPQRQRSTEWQNARTECRVQLWEKITFTPLESISEAIPMRQNPLELHEITNPHCDTFKGTAWCTFGSWILIPVSITMPLMTFWCGYFQRKCPPYIATAASVFEKHVPAESP